MARFDVFTNPDVAERPHTPYFLDVQNDYIAGLETRVVIPLRTEAAFGPRARDLNPLLQVAGDSVVLDTAALGAVPTQALRSPHGHLSAGREDVLAALDTLFGSY
ncbi:MAG: CcdB family protein [Aquabacterium sp.]|nr:CcdB family protein [Aquabacterium sp.]